LLVPGVLLGALFLCGCQSEEVSTYRVPHSEEYDPRIDKVRLLGAILSRPDATWFFKLAGPIDAISNAKDAFTAVIQSVRFQDAAISWKTPEGWKEEKGNDIRYATLRQEKTGLELTVTRLPATAADLKRNVDRWRKNDLDLGPVSEAELEKLVKKSQVEGNEVHYVDMIGPGPRKVAAGPKGGKLLERAKPGPGALPIEYKAPEGWTETGPREKMGVRILTAFAVREDGKNAEVTVTPPQMIAGDLRGNVDRWRAQVGSPPMTEAEFKALDIPAFQVGGKAGKYFDLTGPAGPNRKRMLLVMVNRGRGDWYFKMVGDAELVARQKKAFESFLQSVKFTGAADE
jgi:hypothetical protein